MTAQYDNLTTAADHAESCACLRPGDAECNCHLAYGFASTEAMDERDAAQRAALREAR
ncbi:hypothetical protein [Noviluteimonas gilva]|uniref:Uncharacterized protein n=1 Tax=Noviluteimonas gilva TaxID=2682097 RepID=A0A7C9I487_9GAMM|nr:hypothetical protein [Lysobacter gilvus]MUV13529.1 hypothetical protein [Lysobacter gilvus]